jgi:hypothetical protein
MPFIKRILTAAVAAAVVSSQADAGMVAVIDTGVNPEGDLATRIVTGGYDFVNNDADPSDDNGHGTIVATILAQTDSGVEVLPIKVLGVDGTGTWEDVAAGIDFATARPKARVLNLSLGGESFPDAGIDALLRAAHAGQLLVFAAGNEGADSPSFPAVHSVNLGGFGIIVGATDGIDIAAYSNRAGGAANYYILADGNTGIEMTIPGGEGEEPTVTQIQGTSFAAPRVAAAASIILDRAPHLTPPQVTEILLSTADDMGPAGVDSIYGHGKLNLARALQPVGGLSVPSSDGGSSASVGTAAAVALGAAVAYAVLGRSKNVKETLVLDSYGRAYELDLGAIAKINDDKTSATSLFESVRRRTEGMEIELRKGMKLTMYTSQPDPVIPDPFNALDEPTERYRSDAPYQGADLALSLAGKAGGGLSYQLNYNLDPRAPYGALALDGVGTTAFLSDRALSTPYLSFAQATDSMNVAYSINERFGVRMGVASTNESEDYGLDSTGAVLEGSYKVSNAATVKLQVGGLREQGSLFGGSSGGPLGVDQSTTTSLGVTGQYKLRRNVALIGHYAEGLTQVKDSNSSMLGDFAPVRSQAYGMGLVAADMFQQGDSFGVALSRPLRVSDGSATLTVPYARDIEGNIYSNSERINLDPTGHETDVEAYYFFDLGKASRVGTYFLYQSEPNHAKELDDQVTFFTSISRKF